ncbi:MAG TPA: PEP/pyruvate-binding domain-containing protein, partial [Gemmatimonadaceae bacterium]
MSDIVRVIPFDRVRMRDLPDVGGKNASLGEMIGELAQAGVRVPGGFATTAAAFREFLAQDDLAGRIEGLLERIDVADVPALREAGTRIRDWILATPLPPALVADIEVAYTELARGHPDRSFAVRSSATAEDLPDASFAGQQDTLLNING